MLWPDRFRSLLAQFILRVVAPLSLVMFGMIGVSLYAYQQVLTALLVDRDRQLAVVTAERISTATEGFARALEALATTSDVRSSSLAARTAALTGAAEVLKIFSAGVAILDQEGNVQVAAPAGASPVGDSAAGHAYFEAVRAGRERAFSDVLAHPQTGDDIIVIAVPIRDDGHAFAGALLGAVHLRDTSLGDPIRQLVIGEAGFAYVVDRNGRVIFHPDPREIGADFTDRPFVKSVMAGQSGGTLWTSPSGERLVQGYTPVNETGWGLIVREPWDAVVAPAQTYAAVIAVAGLAAIAVVAYALWRGVRRIVVPVQTLAQQTARLAAGEPVEPIGKTTIREIDALGRAFDQMAGQIARYRAGLRRYLGAMTQSQEEERRRIARELHDETTQSLLAISRRLELYQATELDEARKAELAQLQATVADTLHGVRRISRDLRPPVLEDLGLVPALQALVRAAREGEGAVPQADFTVSGRVIALQAEQELALYRITQEALTNIRRHAHATGLRVDLTYRPSAVQLDISDDGEGFEVPRPLSELAQLGSFGLMGIQERVWAIGGTLTVHSEPGRGTHLSVVAPANGRR